MVGLMEDEVEMTPADPVQSVTCLSGDPLLKRLVSLAHLGWTAKLVLFSNGSLLSGTLISGSSYRAALSESVRRGNPDSPQFEVLNGMVANAITEEDADPSPMGLPAASPEPRFIHLASVSFVGVETEPVPFLRLRLPAVSGFWITSLEDAKPAESVLEDG